MKAIVFAAGLGTRLKPYTERHPKALFPLNSKPLLWYAIEKLKAAGVTEVVVNVHHFASQVIDYLNCSNFEIPILISDETDELLDTGGALLKVRNWLDGNEPIVAYNVDIIASVDIARVIEYHQKNNALATLVVRQRETSRYFLFDDLMQLTGWQNTSSGEEIITNERFAQSSPWAFSGIQILSPNIFNHITETGKFSVTPLYLQLAQTHKIIGYPDNSDFWLDLGKPGQIQIAEEWIAGNPIL